MLIVGYGRVGQVVGDLMRVHKVDYLCLDGDARLAAGPARAASQSIGATRRKKIFWRAAASPTQGP